MPSCILVEALPGDAPDMDMIPNPSNFVSRGLGGRKKALTVVVVTPYPTCVACAVPTSCAAYLRRARIPIRPRRAREV